MRIQKVLEDTNVRLASVVSDVVGESGRRMLTAIIAGQTDAKKLAALGSDRLSASRETLAQALHGKVTAHHRFLLKQHLQRIEHLWSKRLARSRLRLPPFVPRSNA